MERPHCRTTLAIPLFGRLYRLVVEVAGRMGARLPCLQGTGEGAYFANSLISPGDAAHEGAVEMCVARAGVPFLPWGPADEPGGSFLPG